MLQIGADFEGRGLSSTPTLGLAGAGDCWFAMSILLVAYRAFSYLACFWITLCTSYETHTLVISVLRNKLLGSQAMQYLEFPAKMTAINQP